VKNIIFASAKQLIRKETLFCNVFIWDKESREIFYQKIVSE